MKFFTTFPPCDSSRRPARDLLMLAGWIGLSLTVEPILGPLVYGGLWFTARRFQPRNARPVPWIDVLALILGSLVGGSDQFFLGHGLACVQLVRMRRNLNPRENVSMLLITLLHFAVVCTTILDIRFLAIFIAMVLLAPRALMELASAPAASGASSHVNIRPPLRLSIAQYLLIGSMAVAVFALFPRAFLGGGWRGAGRSGAQSMLDPNLDPSRGGMENSRRIFMQVDGENLGYLRAAAYLDFDGQVWRRQNEGGLIPLFGPSAAPLRPSAGTPIVKRQARVKQVNSLYASASGRVLPATPGFKGWRETGSSVPTSTPTASSKSSPVPGAATSPMRGGATSRFIPSRSRTPSAGEPSKCRRLPTGFANG